MAAAVSHRRHTSLCSIIGWSSQVDDELLMRAKQTHICHSSAWSTVLYSVNIVLSPFFSITSLERRLHHGGI